MVGPGMNLATTKDGETYNKLQRPPQTYLSSTAPPLPPTKSLPFESPAGSTKRKRDYPNAASGHKRTRLGQENALTEGTFAAAGDQEEQRSMDYGMRTMLPSFDHDEHSSDDSMGEALAYLRSVRSEASVIPHLLVGSNSDISTDGAKNDRGIIFREGTLIAIDQEEITSGDEEHTEGNADALLPQDRYYQLLLKRFHHLRITLQASEERGKVNTPKTNSAAATEPFLPRSERAWTNTLSQDPPKLEQILRLDERAIYSGLGCCARSLDDIDSISTPHSCWIWSLLAVAGDVGTMSHEKVGSIRNLGLTAGVMSVRLRALGVQTEDQDRDISTGQRDGVDVDGDINSSDAEMSISGDEETAQSTVEPSDLERARASLLSQLGDRLVHAQLPPSKRPSTPSRNKKAAHRVMNKGAVLQSASTDQNPPLLNSYSMQMEGRRESKDTEQTLETASNSQGKRKSAVDGIDLNTRVTIDMVLTIVAEYFGQRDLLAYRKPW